MRKAAALSALILLAGSAAALTASIGVEDRSAGLEDPAHFVIEAENDRAFKQSFKITRLSSPPKTAGWFSYPYSRTVEGGENATFDIEIFPSEYSVQQNYRFTVNLDASETDEEEIFQEYFSVDTGTELSIFSSGIDKESYNPGDTVKASLVLVNTAQSPVRDYKITAASMGEVKTAEGGVIPSGAKKEFGFSFEVPEESEPGKRELEINVKRDSKTTVKRSFSIEQISDITKESYKTNNVLSSTETVSAENKGNAVENVTLNLTVASYLQPLTTFSTSADKVEDIAGKKNYYWTKSLTPGSSFSVERKTDYWPPLFALGLLIAGLAALERLYVGIKSEKTAKTVEEGVKIRIEVVNRSRHSINEVEVKDFVPDIASVDTDFAMAAPTVAKTGEGTRLTWDIGSLNPGEQRVMEYVVSPSVKVEGGVTFPRAEITVEDEKLTETSEVTADFDPSNHE